MGIGRISLELPVNNQLGLQNEDGCYTEPLPASEVSFSVFAT